MDTKHRVILSCLESNPSGLGFNELSRALRNKMAPLTIRERLSDLYDWGFVKRTPENPRQGQKVTYKSAHVYKYSEFHGKITFRWSNREDATTFCICCPPYAPDIPHPHCYSRTIKFYEDRDLSDIAQFFLNSFNLDGKRVRVTFEVLPD